MSFLRQSTQVVKKIGPYLDKTDGVTEETGLGGAATEISKEPGAAFGTGPTLGTHDAEGWYPVTLTTTHTDTVGLLKLKGHDAATHLPVWEEWTVVEEAVYDAMYAASASGPNTTTPPTVGEIQTEMEEDGASLLDTIRDELANATDGLSALKTLIDAIPTTPMRGTDSVVLSGPTKAEMDAAHGLLATEAKQDIMQTAITAIKTVTDKIVFTVANLVDSNMKAISDDTGAADRLEALMDSVLIITVNDASATLTAFAADGFTEAVDDIFKGRLMTFLDGANQFEQTDITGYDAADGPQGAQEFTVTALTAAPAEDVNAIVH